METKFALEPGPVSCLPNELRQVVLNMLVNAAHAIADKLGDNPEGDKGVITITIRRDGDSARIYIRDTGSGIPPSILSKKINSFFTTKYVEKGTGQGLAIAHDVIVAMHGGTIEVEDEFGVGSTFCIGLPL